MNLSLLFLVVYITAFITATPSSESDHPEGIPPGPSSLSESPTDSDDPADNVVHCKVMGQTRCGRKPCCEFVRSHPIPATLLPHLLPAIRHLRGRGIRLRERQRVLRLPIRRIFIIRVRLGELLRRGPREITQQLVVVGWLVLALREDVDAV